MTAWFANMHCVDSSEPPESRLLFLIVLSDKFCYQTHEPLNADRVRAAGLLTHSLLNLEKLISSTRETREVPLFAPVLDPTRLTMPQGEDFHEPFVVLARYLTAIRNDRLAGDKFRVVR